MFGSVGRARKADDGQEDILESCQRQRKKLLNLREGVACIVFRVQGTKEETWWGFSSVGRAPALQAGGQRFEPANLHHGSLAQSVRALA